MKFRGRKKLKALLTRKKFAKKQPPEPPEYDLDVISAGFSRRDFERDEWDMNAPYYEDIFREE